MRRLILPSCLALLAAWSATSCVRAQSVPAFDYESFAHQLLSEALFYDAEYGALGTVSLVDKESARERYLAAYDSERDTYLIEEAIEWDSNPYEDGAVDFVLALDGKEYGAYVLPEEAAEALLTLAREQDLTPIFLVPFEVDAPVEVDTPRNP